MKKIIIFILCISSLFGLTVCGAEAKETYTPVELTNYWERVGYPDYIGGVYYKDDMQTFVIVFANATQEEKDELLASLIYKNIETTEGKYSRNRLWEIQDEISSLMESDIGNFQSSKVDDINNCIIVAVKKEGLQKYTEYFESTYGDAVIVKEATGIIMLTILDAKDIAGIGAIDGIAPTVKNTDIYYYLFVVMLTAILLVTVTRLRRMRTAAYSTADGRVVAHSSPISQKEIIRQIENSALTPNDEVFTSIKQKISNSK